MYINVIEIRSFVKPTLDWLLNQRYSSGNFQSSLESSSSDRLVQWCHGAPGFVPLCILAHQVKSPIIFSFIEQAPFSMFKRTQLRSSPYAKGESLLYLFIYFLS